MNKRIRLAVMALSFAVIALGTALLRIPPAHAAKICSNTACLSASTCSYRPATVCYLNGGSLPDGSPWYTCGEDMCN